MTWLVLFDIDGTLLLTHDDVYVEANRLALNEVFGAAPAGDDVPGDTATAHTRCALVSAGFTNGEVDAGLRRWCDEFASHYVRLLADTDTSHWEAGPGAEEAIAATERHALLTGNPPAVAFARMQRLGLDGYFRPGDGAFGCERENAQAACLPLRPRAASSSSRSHVSAPATGRPSGPSPSATRRSTSRVHTPPAAAASP